MSRQSSATKGGAASRNGHAAYGSTSASNQNPPPKKSPAASNAPDPESFLFPHITLEEEGLAAPADTLPRPTHPDLGGPLYVSFHPGA